MLYDFKTTVRIPFSVRAERKGMCSLILLAIRKEKDQAGNGSRSDSKLNNCLV